MARTSGKRLDEKAIEFLTKHKTVTPAEFNKFLGIGDYASKQICLLKRMGYKITTNKDGRKVASYTYEGPADVIYASTGEALKAKRGQKAKTMEDAKKEKAAKLAEAEKVKAAAISVPSALPASKNAGKKVTEKAAAAKKSAKTPEKDSKAPTPVASKPRKEPREKSDHVEKTFGSSGAISGHSVDADWDSMEGVNVADFLR